MARRDVHMAVDPGLKIPIRPGADGARPQQKRHEREFQRRDARRARAQTRRHGPACAITMLTSAAAISSSLVWNAGLPHDMPPHRR